MLRSPNAQRPLMLSKGSHRPYVSLNHYPAYVIICSSDHLRRQYMKKHADLLLRHADHLDEELDELLEGI